MTSISALLLVLCLAWTSVCTRTYTARRRQTSPQANVCPYDCPNYENDAGSNYIAALGTGSNPYLLFCQYDGGADPPLCLYHCADGTFDMKIAGSGTCPTKAVSDPNAQNPIDPLRRRGYIPGYKLEHKRGHDAGRDASEEIEDADQPW